MRWLICSALLLAACGHSQPQEQCPQLDCKVSCPGGFVKDDRTGCPSCVCNGYPALDGGSCPATTCNQQSCGLGFAVDVTTGCPTCACCNPADCQPGGCHGFGADGCPTCGPCN